MRFNFHFDLKSLFCFTGAVLVSLNAQAQDEDAPPSSVENQRMTIVAADDGSGGPPMVISAMSSSVDGQPPVFSFVSPGADGVGFGPAMAFPGMGPMDPLALIHNSDIQKEIELDSQQYDDYKKLDSDFKAQMQELTNGMKDGKFEREKMRELAASMKKLRDVQSSRVKEILLPHQFERLQQISTQQFIQNAGTANALTNKVLMEQLGLTEEQVERLKKRNEEVTKELKEKMETLQEEAKQKLLSELTSEQREKLEKLTGKKYKFKAPELPTGIRNRIQARQNQGNTEGK